MSNKRKREFTDNLNKCYNVVQQSSSKGINAVDIAKQLGVHRTTVHSYLNTLELMEKVYSEHGLWYAKKDKQDGDQPLEKEIVIELPIPKNVWSELATLEVLAKHFENLQLTDSAELIRILLEKFDKTRTIRIRGRNVDSIDLEKVQSLVQQAYEHSSKTKFGNVLKRFKGAV
jgi:uncharacterized protein YdeI (YjbR/CyaY-like superfamily)